MTEATKALEGTPEEIEAVKDKWFHDASNFWEEGEAPQVKALRPQKRAKVWKWLMSTWNILMAMTGHGWDFFRQPQDPNLRKVTLFLYCYH